tara:strand:+ start:11249 stop:11980 length:732 start_codon:yes stop_codon:yes gene_type:complete
MTPTEFREYILVTYDSIANFAAPGYEDADINIFVNAAQEDYVKSMYSDISNLGRIGFEETEKRSKDLSELKRFEDITPFISPANHGSDSLFVELPDNYLLTVNEEATISFTSCGATASERVPVKPIREDYYNANVKNPYKRPDNGLVWRIDASRTDTTLPVTSTKKRHELVLGTGSTFNTYHLSYIKYPKSIDVSDTTNLVGFCELDPSTHRAIADMAVQYMLEAARQPRFQTSVFKESRVIE